MRTRRLIISGVALLAVVAGGTACNNSSDGGSTPTTAAQHTSSTTGRPASTGRPDLHLEAVLGREQASQIQRVLHAPDQSGQGQWTSMPQFLQYVVDDARQVWNWYYQQWGLTITSEVNTVFVGPGDSVPTACNDVADDSAFFYCPADDTIYVSQERAARKWNGTDRGDGQPTLGGDFAAAVAVAHEYGHNVQNELKLPMGAVVKPSELQADCLAGAFTHVAYYQGILDADDITEGAQARFDVGDDSSDPAQHHGTPEERRDAFLTGYNGQTPDVCVAYNPFS